MRARLLAFALAVGVLAGVPHFLLARKPRSCSRCDVALTPDAVGPYRVTRRWNRTDVAYPNALEQNAVYDNRAGDAPIVLAVIVGSHRTHDGIWCYLTQGGTVLHSYGVQKLKTADSSGLFDLALIRDDSGDTSSTLLVGATECWAAGCRETPRGLVSLLWFRLGTITPMPKRSPVPVLISVEQAGEVLAPGQQAQLFNRFKEFVANLDLRPMRALSAAQSS